LTSEDERLFSAQTVFQKHTSSKSVFFVVSFVKRASARFERRERGYKNEER
jgi:hypothetical protein